MHNGCYFVAFNMQNSLFTSLILSTPGSGLLGVLTYKRDSVFNFKLLLSSSVQSNPVQAE